MTTSASQLHFDPLTILDLQFPDECRAGIEANLELMSKHARILENYLARLHTSALSAKASESCS